MEVRVVLYGVGAIGSQIAKLLLEKKGMKIVGAIDAAEDKVGRNLSEILGLDQKLKIIVSADPETMFSNVNAHVVIHATSSSLKDVYPQIAPLAKYGVNVISTCEELSYPSLTEPMLAKKLDALGKKYGVTFLGTGINPGFIMDTLAIVLTGICQRIDKIQIERVINAATRRVPFMKKIGSGLSVSEFKRKIVEKEITGHVGLTQSIGMISSALKWNLDKIEGVSIEPVVSEENIENANVKVKKGQVAGLRQCAKGIKKQREVITLEFQAYMGAAEEYDSIAIDGIPPIHLKISPCVHGDLATVAAIVNSIPKVLKADPGLVTMKDLPLPSAVTEDLRKYL